MATVLERLRAALASRYAVEREIGRGGMATVFLAQDLKHGRPVALKVLRSDIAAAVGAERFLQEIEIAARLNHPHILPLHDSGDAEGFLYYVMPYVAGESLRDRLNEQGQLALEEALHIAREVADALDYAHRHNVVHRDIKPENILLVEGHALVADFGIARAIRAAGKARATETGVAVGTPEYMSPEQAGGRMEPDGRSDIYALGCVLYEMLAGEPPFTAPSLQGLVARHLSDPPPRLRTIRSTVPIEVEQVIETALAKAPADRFASAQQFAAALPIISGPRPPRAPALSSRAQRWAVLTSATALVAMAYLAVPRIFVGANLDRSLYVVVPFGHRGGAAPKLLDGDQCEFLLYGALRFRWEDVNLVGDHLVHDLRLRLGAGRPPTFSDALGLARELKAGRLLWGEVTEFGDTSYVRAALYDVTRAVRVREHSVRLGRDARDVTAKFAELADSLFVGRARSREVAGGASGTRVFAALQAYVEGHEARAGWDLTTAERAFRKALEFDPGYPQAKVWLAQTLLWTGRPAAEWRGFVLTGGLRPDSLDRRDRAVASALLNIGNERLPQACEVYRQLLARDSTDFLAWFGLGECQRRDNVVVRDAASPSGWRWRSSFHAAVIAYERALEVAPSAAFAFPPFSRLAQPGILVVHPYQPRLGTASPPDTGKFRGYAALDHDTLAFVPVREDAFGRTPPPATLNAAVAASRQRLLRLMRRWVREFPDSSQPYQELAHGLELTGALDAGGGVEGSALTAAGQAAKAARTRTDSIATTVLQVRLLVKLGRFEAGRDLARDALARWRDAEPRYAAQLASLAALIGKVHVSARLSAAQSEALLAHPDYRGAPLPVLEASRRLLGYAAFGVPQESIAVLTSRLDTVLRVYADPKQAARLRCAVLLMPRAYAFPQLRQVLEGAHCTETPMLLMQRALAAGDSVAVRGLFDRWKELRRDVLPGDLAIEHVYHEAWLLLQVRDTLAAAEYADRQLAALPALRRTVILEDPVQSAALVRLMALRAELAGRAGDRVAARRWAEPVAALWRDADSELQAVVTRMRALARGENEPR